MLRVDPRGETYESVEKLIYLICHKYVDRSRGIDFSFEELHGVAIEAYLRAYDAYDSDHQVPFHNFVAKCVNNALLDHRKKRRLKSAPWPESEGKAMVFPAPVKSQFDLRSVLSHMTADAKEVVELVVDTPEDLADAIKEVGGRGYRLQKVFRKFMKGKGWSLPRWNKCVEEIREALVI